jgi:hypothetical protein
MGEFTHYINSLVPTFQIQGLKSIDVSISWQRKDCSSLAILWVRPAGAVCESIFMVVLAQVNREPFVSGHLIPTGNLKKVVVL